MLRRDQTRLRSIALWPGILVALLFFTAEVLYWAVHIRPAYFPVGDEFALLVSSTRFFHPNAGDWFRHGFSGYFCPYPDLSLPYSNFLRPLANFTYYTQSLVFGRHWGEYLLGSYIIETALVVTVWYLARICLRLPLSISLLLTVSAGFSPALGYQAIFRPSFAFDLLAALWALLALVALLRRRWSLAWFCVVLAVLTKESAYYVAPAACAAAWLQQRGMRPVRRLLRAGVYLLPLLFTVLLRKLDFPGAQGAYVLNEAAGGSPVKKLLLALTRWPYMLPGEQHIFAFSAHNLLALSLTAAIWISLLVFCAGALHRGQGTPAVADGTTSLPGVNVQVLLIFFAGSLFLPLALDLGTRFGASTFPLLFLCLGAAAAPSAIRPAPLLRWAAITILAITLAADAGALFDALAGSAFHREQALWARSRNLVDLLSRERQPVVFLAGDASESFSSPSFVQRFAGYRGTVVPLSNLGVGHCAHEQLTVRPEPGRVYAIRLVAPETCSGNSLGATFHTTPGLLSTFTRTLPQAIVMYDAHGGGWKDGQFSARDLDLRIFPKVPAFAVVYPLSEGSPVLLETTSGTQDNAKRPQN